MPTRITNEDEATTYFLTRSTADINYVNQIGDTMQGDLDINYNKLMSAVMENCKFIPDMVTPMGDYSLVCKAYLDARLQGLDAIYANETGDTMEGDIDMSRHKLSNLRDPTNPTDATNKRYIDNKNKNHFVHNKDALIMVKPINMASKKIAALGEPTDPGDAANKAYVDKRRDDTRYFREEANLRGVMATIRISDIPLPTVQNSSQVYVSVSILDNDTTPIIFTQVTKIVNVTPVNTLSLNIVLTTTGQDIGHVTIEGLIFIAPNATTATRVGTVTITDGTAVPHVNTEADLLNQPASVLTPEVRRQLTE